MSALQTNITSQTPLGANLVGGGATFRVWAPRAKAVFVSGDFNNWSRDDGKEGFKRDPYARELSEVPTYPLSNCIL